MKRWSSALRIVLATALMVVFGGIAAAQTSTSGDITGVVRDPSGAPVAGATVVANGPQGARATTTDANGSYLIEFLNPGSYDVTATAQGFQPVTQRAVSIRLGARSSVNLAVAPMAETEETITITAAAPTVDVGTTSTSTNIGADIIGSIPTSRTFAGLVALAPGVVSGGDLGYGNPSISGSSALENSYIVNGVNITNQGYGSSGSYSIVYGSLGSGVNFDFIDAVQVKSAGFEAEYGEATGGIINVTTKRGTNDFHGSIFGNLSPEVLESERRQRYFTTGNAIIGKDASQDVGVTLGGPIVKDKFFFFAAVNPQSTSLTARAPSDGPYPLKALGFETRRRDRTSYAGTLSWNVVANHTLELSAFGDPGVSQQGFQSTGDLLAQSTAKYSALEFGGNNQILRYTGVLGSFMSIEGHIAHAQNIFAQTFPSSSDQDQFRDNRNPAQTIRGGGVGYYEKSQVGDNTEYSLKATNYVNLAGRHEIKYGGNYQDVRWNANINRSGSPGATFTDEQGNLQTFTTGKSYNISYAADGVTPIYRVSRGNYSDPNRKTTTQYTAIFLQDKYSPISTVTIDLGLRAEQQKLVGSGVGHLGYTFKFADNLAPRLGASWDYTGKGRGKLFAHYSKYIEKIPNDIAVRSLSTELGVSRVDYFSNDFTAANQIPEGTVPDKTGSTAHVITNGSEPTQIAKGTKSATEDEVTAGVEYEPVETVNFGMRYIHRQVGRVLEDYALNAYEDVVAGTADFGPYVVGNPGTSLNSTCPPAYPNCWVAPKRNYDALEFTVDKRLTTNWQVLGSYRLARLFGNYEGLYRNDNGQSDPNISSNFDFPNNTPAMKSLGASGPLNTDRTHVFKMAGSYMTNFGLNAGAFFTFQSGIPKNALDPNLAYGNTGEIPEGKRGSQGREPSSYQIDLHTDYALPLRKGLDLRASLDVFNVLDNQAVTQHWQYAQLDDGAPDPDFGKNYIFQDPRYVRLGLRLSF